MTLILLIIYFAVDYKKSFPLIVSILLLFNYFTVNFGIPLPGLGLLEVGYIFIWIFLFKSFLLLKKIKHFDFFLRLSIFLIVIYFVYIIFLVITKQSSILSIYKNTRPLVIQFYIFIAIVYSKIYKLDVFYRVVYFGSLLFLIIWSGYIFLIPFRNTGNTIGLAAFHSAIVGMTSAYIISFNLFINNKKNTFKINNNVINFFSAILPFLGMARGGIISVLIVFMVYFIVKKKLKTFIQNIFILLIIIYFSNLLITSFIPRNIIYEHQGSNNLVELWKRTEDVEETVSTRLIRWGFLIDKIYENPFFGNSVFLSTSGSGLKTNQFIDVWQGHNFFLSMLASLGIVFSLPILLLFIVSIFKSFRLLIRNNRILFETAFSIVLIFNVLNINLTNTYFIFFWSGTYIWSLFGISLSRIIQSPKNS